MTFPIDAAHEAWLLFLAYFPLGVIGLWRWSVWGIKRAYAASYRPATTPHRATVAVVTPVYNERPDVFRRALKSWRENGVEEIVAVIDYTDTACLAVFKECSEQFSGARLIVTKKPGKRPALVDGINVATTDIVALVDSDTIWADGAKAAALSPFRDSKVGGVATRQNVLAPTTLAQRIFNAQLNLRYLEELPFMVGGGGKVVTCISGRTGFYRRAAVMPLLDKLEHETFWGKPVISGDDKRLTYLIEAAGWKVAFQQNAQVYTPGTPRLRTFFKQRLRWTRNSWRADLRTLTEPWVYRHPGFVWYLLDRTVQPFAQLLSPIFFIVSLALGLWLQALILLIWWHLGRTVRLLPHLRRHPRDIFFVPLFVAVNFYTGLMKIYALITLNRQGWITRWDSKRLPGPPPWLKATGAYAATGLIVALLAAGVTNHERAVQDTVQAATAQLALQPLTAAPPPPIPPTPPPVQIIDRYEVQPGDTLTRVSQKFNLPAPRLLAYNATLLPSEQHIEPGLALSVPAPNTATLTPTRSSDAEQLGPLRITYVASTNTIEVRGRGQQITLAHLARATVPEQLRELTPGEWYLAANLTLKAGVTLSLTSSEVQWLKLKSDPSSFVAITAESGSIIIEGTKVTSWDNSTGHVDETITDGRSYLLAKGQSRFDINGAELAFLGYSPARDRSSGTSGVAWLVPDEARAAAVATGHVTNSSFHHNFHGAYASGAIGMLWHGNEFSDNHAYGLDLFGASRQHHVVGNTVRRNGRHGIILSRDCTGNIVAKNHIAGNGRHGLMLHAASQNNLVTGNDISSNHDGIVAYQSGNNVVTDNTIRATERGVRFTQTTGNLLATNTIHADRHAVYLTNASDHNTIQGNTIAAETYGLYLGASGNSVVGNDIQGKDTGLYLALPATANHLVDNRLSGSSRFGLYSKAAPGAPTYAAGTTWKNNRTDIAIYNPSGPTARCRKVRPDDKQSCDLLPNTL